jgi:predicted Zn-dependent protease
MGVYLTYRNYPDSAISFYEKAIRLDPNLVPAKINLGVLRYQNGAYAEAQQLLEPCVNEDPRNALIAYYLGLAYRRNDMEDKGLAELNRAAALGGEYGKEAMKALKKK